MSNVRLVQHPQNRGLGPAILTGLRSALELDDYVLDLDLTPNRPDCLSVLGVAREVAALCGSRLKSSKINLGSSAMFL